MMSKREGRGCCERLRLREDNARFLLLAVVMVIYMTLGALLFMCIERSEEVRHRKEYLLHVDVFRRTYNVSEKDLRHLLNVHADAASAGLLDDKRHRWDFAGSFYFVGTVVSTIGNFCLHFKLFSVCVARSVSCLIS